MRTFWGLVLGGLLFFPGTVLVQWAIKSLGIYQNPTVTDACMSIIMVLLTVFVVQHKPVRAASSEARERRASRQAAGAPPPRYADDARPAARRPGRRPRDWDEER
jgi:hypothetical protein